MVQQFNLIEFEKHHYTDCSYPKNEVKVMIMVLLEGQKESQILIAKSSGSLLQKKNSRIQQKLQWKWKAHHIIYW